MPYHYTSWKGEAGLTLLDVSPLQWIRFSLISPSDANMPGILNDFSTTLLCFILKYAKSLHKMYELHLKNITHILTTSPKYHHRDWNASGYNKIG